MTIKIGDFVAWFTPHGKERKGVVVELNADKFDIQKWGFVKSNLLRVRLGNNSHMLADPMAVAVIRW